MADRDIEQAADQAEPDPSTVTVVGSARGTISLGSKPAPKPEEEGSK